MKIETIRLKNFKAFKHIHLKIIRLSWSW